MGKAQREEHILVRRAEDVGHVVVVAHDLDRGGDAGHGEILGVIDQRAGQEPVGQQKQDHPERDRTRDQTDQPAKGGQHGVLFLTAKA